MYLFFLHNYVASKIETNGKMEKNNSEIKEELFKSLIDAVTEFNFK